MKVDGYLRSFRMLTGAKAQIEIPFGYPLSPKSSEGASAPYLLPGRSISPVWKNHSLHGITRIARVRSAPQLTFIEDFDSDIFDFHTLRILALYCTSPVVLFRSVIAAPLFIRDTKPPQSVVEAWVPEFFQETHVAYEDGRTRYLSVHRDNVPASEKKKRSWNYHLEEKGDMAWFECPQDYSPRLLRDRFSRSTICRQLSRMGIDPERTIDGRELDDPVLFTEGNDGTSVAEFPADMASYEAAATALENILCPLGRDGTGDRS